MAEYTPTNWKNGDKITAEKLNKIEAQLAAISNSNIPAGLISAYHGTVDSIPDGWVVCDGTNDTPDLRDKFVLSAGTTHTVGETGGSEEVTLTVDQMPAHSHSIEGNLTASDQEGTSAKNIASRALGTSNIYEISTKTSGSSAPHPNMPPYYSLLYIMKT